MNSRRGPLSRLLDRLTPQRTPPAEGPARRMSGGDWPERVAGEVRAIMGACPGWEVWWRPGRFEAGGGYWARRDGQTLHASNRVTLVGLVRWAESKDGP